MRTAAIRKQMSRAPARTPRTCPVSPAAAATGPGRLPAEQRPSGAQTAAPMTLGAGPTSSAWMRRMASYLWTIRRARPEPICRVPLTTLTPTPWKCGITADWSPVTWSPVILLLLVGDMRAGGVRLWALILPAPHAPCTPSLWPTSATHREGLFSFLPHSGVCYTLGISKTPPTKNFLPSQTMNSFENGQGTNYR